MDNKAFREIMSSKEDIKEQSIEQNSRFLQVQQSKTCFSSHKIWTLYSSVSKWITWKCSNISILIEWETKIVIKKHYM